MGGDVPNLLVPIPILLHIETDKSGFLLAKSGREFGPESEIRFLRLPYPHIAE